ncbi:MAG: hypothetical protein KDA68_20060, partial [Planctomycetaceae bacterium]|nr:hypothetical protein [Planctomycetaceae bacterium]
MTDRTEMNGATESPQEESPEERWIFIRPPENLNRLSDEAKWEVTRRHPYYQILWRIARPDETFEVTHGTQRRSRFFRGVDFDVKTALCKSSSLG